ncbi:TRAP transporter substrate-binding protein [Roseibacterium beibuensis]|uniref:TRAP transporter substrate-binding protein n=1 Tax=[Roseibacterium] beibuensis TaxID=1193142 RepID=A0ABP9KS49_9RHOB|nr:TRAP transporter substrate-binding protein [Roseibacterium beibuensis]MCS6622456.1 TRAP transporter substrate-binding protein [Roseibacterium beibuensis]
MFNKLLIAGAVVAASVSMGHAQTALDMTNEYEPNSIHGQGDQFFAEQVNNSGAGVEITLHLGGALGFRSADNLDAVGDGVVPIADTLGGVLAGSDPIFLVGSLPFVAANPEEARALYEAARPYYEAFFEEHGQMLLYASPWPSSGLWANEVVDTVEALAGLTMRTYDVNGTRTLIAAGASPIQLSWADVVPQLATGGIEGVLTSAEGGVNASFHEHLSHFTEINYAMPLNFVHMNRDAFEALPPEGQQAIVDAAAATDARNWQALADRVSLNYETLRGQGVIIVEEITPELQAHLADAASVVLEDWLEQTGDAGAAVLSAYGESVGRSY